MLFWFKRVISGRRVLKGGAKHVSGEQERSEVSTDCFWQVIDRSRSRNECGCYEVEADDLLFLTATVHHFECEV